SADYQEKTRTILAKALDELEDLANNLDAKELDLEDFVKDVKEFVAKWRQSGVVDVMADPAKQLRVPDSERGLAGGQKALKILEDLLKSDPPEGLAGGPGGGGRLRFRPGPIGDAMRGTLSRILGQKGRGLGTGGQDANSRNPLDDVGLF